MRQSTTSLLLALLLLISGCGDKTENSFDPLPGPVILRPAFLEKRSFAPTHDPYVLLETQYEWHGCCSEIALARSADTLTGPVTCQILGVQVSTYFTSPAPATAQILLPRIPFSYDLYLSYDEFTDHYRVHIDESLLVVAPLKRNFTIIGDTLIRSP